MLVAAVSVEAYDASNAEDPLRTIEPLRNQSMSTHANHRRVGGNQMATHQAIDHCNNIISSKLKVMEGVTSYHSHAAETQRAIEIKDRDLPPARSQAPVDSVLKTIEHPHSRDSHALPMTLDSMDCSSGESLGMEHSAAMLPQNRITSYHTRMENLSFTSSKLEKLRSSKLDNPEAISAMLLSRHSPTTISHVFPLGTTIGAGHLDDSDSVDASEITMRTMEELGIVSEESGMELQLMRSRTYPSNLVQKKYFRPTDTNISAATQAARNKCLDVLNAPRRSIPVDTLPPAERQSLAFDGDLSDPECSNDLFSPPSAQSTPTARKGGQSDLSAKSAPMVIRIDRLPEPSASNILFEYQGEMFRHAPLPSGWEVRISKSKNRPFYVHPERGATWYCPVANPVGAVKVASPMESMLELSSTDGENDEDTETFDSDDVESLTSAESGVSMGKTGNANMTKNDVTNTTMSSTMDGSASSNVVKRAVTVEQGDLNVCKSDSTIEVPVCGSATTKPKGEMTIDATSRATIRKKSGCSLASNASKSDGLDEDYSLPDSPAEAIQFNMTSPDEEIESLVRVNLAQRSTRNGAEIVVLYHRDRLESPSQLPSMAESKKCKIGTSTCVVSMADEAKGNPCNQHERFQGRTEDGACVENEASNFALRCVDRKLNAGSLASIDSKVSSKEDDNDAMTNTREPFPDEDDFSPPDDCDVHINVDSVLAASEVPTPGKDRESEIATSTDGGSFVSTDTASDPSVDKISKAEGDPAGDEIHNAIVVGGAQRVFHPKLINTNSDCSVSTIGGGYQRESCAGGTYLSKMSFRILNPPHPICALQALDELSVIAAANQKLSRIQVRQQRPKENTSFTSDPARRLSFLHCR